LLETYLSFAPRGFGSFLQAMPLWLKDKLYLKSILKKELSRLGSLPAKSLPPLYFTEHHRSHAASAFFASPFSDALVLCLDGVGEWTSSSIWLGQGNRLELKREMSFPHSLGLLYSAFTYHTGFKVNSAEYKMMGLAPYGEPKYVELILDRLIDLKEDGSFRLNMEYFDFATGLKMTNRKFADLFGPARRAESAVTQREMDLARSIQAVTEEVVLRILRHAKAEYGQDRLCLAGGVALNCVCNGRILREGLFRDLWIQPAAGDAGGALGAALSLWHEHLGRPRETSAADRMAGAYLGPSYSGEAVGRTLESFGADFEVLTEEALLDRVTDLIGEGKVVGWFQGRMEFGPRALGARSILGDARNPQMQSTMNLKIKQRESFRPFAPAVLAERVADYFEFQGTSPYMMLVADVQPGKRLPANGDGAFGIDKLRLPRSVVPAVTHVDYSARLQTVDAAANPRFHGLLKRFEAKTGCPMLINTSFNVRGEPIVESPEDAYRCFMDTEMDYLVVENFILSKERQPRKGGDHWRRRFELD
ncbi:MAG TPA: carbamoyltransferase N-terminal domain-containing protein, partial [bacterium]|nr:carbamoyltransferase N-terminal domain-containing protein [bacterium]